MKNKIKIILVVILVGFMTGCSESFLEEFPRLQQSDVLTFDTYDGLYKATAGTYDRLCGAGWYGAGFVITADLKGGNAKRILNSGRYVNEYLWINTPASTSGLWDDAYRTIARANNVINVIDDGFEETGVDQADIDVLKGECLFLRALSHWDLVRMYALPYSAGTGNLGVPVVLVTENGYPARNTVGEVYTQIVADLIAAEAILPAVNHRDIGDEMGWATSWAAKALLAKVYLYEEDWANAAAKAGELIDVSAGFSLFTAAEYTTWDLGGHWGSAPGGDEIIFQVDGSESNNVHPWWEAISYMVDPGGYGDIGTSVDLLNLYEVGDVRADLFIDPGLAAWPGEKWTLKYPGRLGGTPHREFNTPVLRLAEMYLIRAEAYLNTTGDALADYNAIRTNRGLALATTVTLADIYDERRRELNFEGNELFDLSRTGRSLDREDANVAVNKDVAFTAGGSALDNYLWAMPIPIGEMDANVNMEQNPGY